MPKKDLSANANKQGVNAAQIFNTTLVITFQKDAKLAKVPLLAILTTGGQGGGSGRHRT